MMPRRRSAPGSASPAPEPFSLAGPDRRAILAALRERPRRLEGPLAPGRLRVLALGLPAVDRTLPWGGLPRGCLHEVLGAGAAAGGEGDGAAAATGFCVALLGRLARDGPVLWIAPRDDLFAPGLAELGLPLSRLLVVRARRRAETLWAFEEALRTPALAAALAEADGTTLTQTRRLQLAAEGSGVVGLLLRRAGGEGVPSAAVTRWRVGVAPSRESGGGGGRRDEPGAPRWQVELARCRGGGAAGTWTVEWQDGDWRQVEEDGVPATRRGRGNVGIGSGAGAVGAAAGPGDRPPRPAPAGGRRR